MENDFMQKEWEWAEEFFRKTGRPVRLFKVDKTKTALIVVDMQNAFVAPSDIIRIPGARGIVANINMLTRACRGAEIPVIWVVSKFKSEAELGLITKFEPSSHTDRKKPSWSELMWDADGAKIWPELEVDAEKDHEVVKCRYSALTSGSSTLERLLRALGRDSLIIVGVATNVCVGTTAMDAMMLDFEVIVVSDATGAFTDFLQQAYLMALKMVFADVVTTAEILEEIKQLVGGGSGKLSLWNKR